jgi:hypothetical protein
VLADSASTVEEKAAAVAMLERIAEVKKKESAGGALDICSF